MRKLVRWVYKMGSNTKLDLKALGEVLLTI